MVTPTDFQTTRQSAKEIRLSLNLPAAEIKSNLLSYRAAKKQFKKLTHTKDPNKSESSYKRTFR